MPEKPNTGHPGNVSLLPSGDRLESAPIIAGPTGFHFNEGDHLSLPDDQIDIVMPQPEAVRLDRPATRGQECDGETLAFHPEQMALIFPFDDWNEPAGCRSCTTVCALGRNERSLCCEYGAGKCDAGCMIPDELDAVA